MSVENVTLEEEDTAVKQPDSVKDETTSPDGLYHIFQNSSNPLRKSFCTGGTVQGKEGDFLAVTKRSSVSINALIYRLAIGMTGSSLAASQYIGAIAADAWERDLTRAVELYTLIAQTPGGFLPDHLVPTALKAGASVGQTVENAVLRDACNWLGIDPDAPINRRQGRPRSRLHNEAGEPTSAGQYIELTLQLDGTVTGRLIASFHGFSSGTNLATLTLTKLASMLVALREGELVSDADLLEAYLDAVDPDWRAKIAEEIGVETSSTAMDPWTILGVEPGASLSDVKRAYKRIMRTVHPDASGMPRWFAQTVNDAYRKLLEELERE